MSWKGFGVMQKLQGFDIQASILDGMIHFLLKHLGEGIVKDDIEFIYPADPKMGDISSNFALKKANQFQKKPREFGLEIKSVIEKSGYRAFLENDSNGKC